MGWVSDFEVDSYGFPNVIWFLMVSYGFLWIPMDAYGVEVVVSNVYINMFLFI